jgi:hypothetical protein
MIPYLSKASVALIPSRSARSRTLSSRAFSSALRTTSSSAARGMIHTADQFEKRFRGMLVVHLSPALDNFCRGCCPWCT